MSMKPAGALTSTTFRRYCILKVNFIQFENFKRENERIFWIWCAFINITGNISCYHKPLLHILLTRIFFCILFTCWETLTWVLVAPAGCSCLCGCCPVGTGRWGCWGGSPGNYHSPPPYDPSTGHSPGQTHKQHTSFTTVYLVNKCKSPKIFFLP